MEPQLFPQNTSSSKCSFSYELPKCHCENASNSNSDCCYHGTLGNVKTNKINPILYIVADPKMPRQIKLLMLLLALLQHYENTYKDFTHNDLTSNINKCGITYNRIYL